jgi:hypothetical protein
MLKAGTLVGDALEDGSMARAIEDAMIAFEVIKLEDETPDAAESRRKAFAAIATGVVNHLVANIEIIINTNKLGTLPISTTKLLGSAGEVV